MDNTKIELQIGDASFVFPVTPESFDIQCGYDHQTVNINGLGEVLLRGKRNLRSISWSSFLPRERYEWCQVSEADFKAPPLFIVALHLAEESAMDIRVNITNLISLPVVISSFNFGQDDGVGDVNYSITLVESRDVDTPSADTQTAGRPVKKVTSHLYKWKKGDTWKKVAKKEMGDTEKWKSLKETNKKRTDDAVKKYKKAHPNEKAIKDEVALIGEKVLIK